MDDNDKKVGEEIKKPVAKKRKYSTTKVKTRNILTNLSYARVNSLDFSNKSYVLDILTFIVQYLNIFLLDLKLETELEKSMLIFVWRNCLPVKLTTFVSTKDNYDTLTKNNLKFKDVYTIIQEYMSSDDGGDQNYNEAKNLLKRNFDEVRYVFSTLFAKIYSRTNESGIQLKSKFEYSYLSWFNNSYQNDLKKEYEQKQAQQITVKSTGKNMNDYKERVFVNEFEQKPLKNELIDLIEVLDNNNNTEVDSSNQQQKNNIIEVRKEEEINLFVKKVKPMNEIKKKFLNEREQRKHEKLMKKKKDLELQLKKNTEQWNLLKPVFKKKDTLKKIR